MGKRLKDYINYIEAKIDELFAAKEKSGESDEQLKLKEDLLIQISFFSHERLIHLIVTVTFAILTFLSLIAALFIENIFLFILTFLLIILLIPYVWHYYKLENGVQRLYQSYDRLK